MNLSELPPLLSQTEFVGSQPGSGFDITTFGLLSGRDEVMQAREVMNENDGEEAVKCLRKAFQVLNPGSHIAKRQPEHGSISFVHCRHATHLGKKYLQLRQIMEERYRVELLRDCLYRIKAAATFVKDLEALVVAEYRTMYAITHDCIQEVPISKLCCLNALCEDLRTQNGHWNCIKQKLHTNRWLQPILGSLYYQLDYVKTVLGQLRDKAIWWLERLIFVGLQVFAHSNVEGVTREMIWNITRGLEDFNSVVSCLNSCSTSSAGISARKCHGFNLKPEYTNSRANIGEHIKTIPFSRVLNVLANERSKYAALETHRFFTTNEEFVRVLYSGKLPNYVWTEDARPHSSDLRDRETSDYHTATGSMTSLSAAVLKVGSLRAPDLSNMESPLVDVARREHTFAENFLLIVCNSTNLLHKKDNTPKQRRGVKFSQSMSCAKPPRGSIDTPVLSRNDSLRKSVSWGDSADGSIRSQLISRYMDMYWDHFGANLCTIFHELCWLYQRSLYQSQIGSLLICNTTVIALVKHMMEHVCLKVSESSAGKEAETNQSDLFPPGCVGPMLSAAKKCLHTAALGAWDTYLCNALASQLSDKCYPTPLVNGEYSTRTGMLLRDTYQPLLNLLREQISECMETTAKGAVLSATKSPPDVAKVVALATRLGATSDVALHWCRTKIHQSLSNMSISNFLLISQTDLKILVDETQLCVYQLQLFLKAVSAKSNVGEEHNHASLAHITQRLGTVSDNLHSLPGLSMKQFSKNCATAASDYFKQTMPLGKIWRQKVDGDLPTSHNIYIEHVLETVLEPVLEGVNKLKQTVQLSVISLAVEAVCQAWITFILHERIKFSYWGAYQLGLDVAYTKSWLRENIANEAVKNSILDLTILKTLTGAVLLLKRQPRKRTGNKIKDSLAVEHSDGADVYIQGESSVHDCEENIGNVSNQHEWLALRIGGASSRSWRNISSCLNPDRK